MSQSIMASLQDQLMKAGLADAKKAKQIQKEKRKQAKSPKGHKPVNETTAAAQQALAEKAARDRELNQRRNEEAVARAIDAQIKQLIETNLIKRPTDQNADAIAYQFTHGKTIKKIYVDPVQQDQLVKGIIAICEHSGSYQLVPKKVAEKISQRNPERVVVLNSPESSQPDEDDPYADYQIPDDLMW